MCLADTKPIFFSSPARRVVPLTTLKKKPSAKLKKTLSAKVGGGMYNTHQLCPHLFSSVRPSPFAPPLKNPRPSNPPNPISDSPCSLTHSLTSIHPPNSFSIHTNHTHTNHTHTNHTHPSPPHPSSSPLFFSFHLSVSIYIHIYMLSSKTDKEKIPRYGKGKGKGKGGFGEGDSRRDRYCSGDG